MLTSIAAAVVASSLLSKEAQQPAPLESQTAPNIVFIMLDEWGHYEWSGAGHPIHETPNIDRIAAEGMRMSQVLAGSCVCAPTRSTLMTGQHTGHTTVRGNGGGTPLRADDVTIAEVLKDKGYATGGFGKWGIGDRGTTGTPEAHGFDEFFGYYHQVHAHTYYPNYLVRNSVKVPLEGNTGHAFKGETFSQYLIHESAKSFIAEQASEGPFFAYLPYTIPHAFYGIPEDDPAYLKFRGNDWDAPQHHVKHPKVAPPDEAQRYAAFVALADRQIGEILDLLESLGIDDNTILFLCGDNGANTGVFLDEDHPRGFFEPNDDPKSDAFFRGGKGSLYEGGLRVPFFVRWPGRIEPGTTSRHLGYFPDVFPTLAGVAGAAVPDGVDGHSLLPTLLHQGEQTEHEALYWEYRGQIAVRMGDWKLVRAGADAPVELFDLSADASETTDVAEEYPQVLARLLAVAASSRTAPTKGEVLDPALRFRGHAAK